MISEFQGEYRWLSNFWHVQIKYEGIEYPSVEHAYQAAKSLIQAEKVLISRFHSPGEAKRYAKKLTIRKDWESVKLNIMLDLVRMKFNHPDLANKLLATGNEELQEGNMWHDTFWGVDLRTGIGVNNLGKILMRVRQEIRG